MNFKEVPERKLRPRKPVDYKEGRRRGKGPVVTLAGLGSNPSVTRRRKGAGGRGKKIKEERDEDC